MGYVDSLNLYAYVGNRPTVATDPLGLWTGHVGVTGMGAFLFAGMYSRGYIVDSTGFGIYETRGVGGVMPPAAASGTLTIGGTNAKTMEDFSGVGSQSGASGPKYGAELLLTDEYQGVDFNYGPLLSPIGFEYHTFVAKTELTRLFNWSDIWENPGHVADVIADQVPYTDPLGLAFTLDVGQQLWKWLRGDCKK